MDLAEHLSSQVHQRGMTLVEMSLVLLILGILARAAISPLTAAQEHRQWRQVQNQIETIRTSLWAHVVAKGALPCPLSLQRVGAAQIRVENDSQDMACTVALGGVPARQLGLVGDINEVGALLDPWNRPYQLALSLVSHAELGLPAMPDWTTPGEASRIGIERLSADLSLCTRAVGSRCPTADVRASGLTFLLFSLGADASLKGDQGENQDADSVFVLQPPSVQVAHPFDDQLVWGTAEETLYWMLRAGWLP